MSLRIPIQLPSFGLSRGASGPVGTWLIKHVVSPLDRLVHQVSSGRVRLSGRRPVLLLTTIGRRTGQARVTPVFYLRGDNRLVVCNVRPAGERPNPWPRNLEATPDTVVQIGARKLAVTARRATASEIERLWPRLLEVWPVYGRHFAATGERHVFVLEPRGHLPEPPPARPSGLAPGPGGGWMPQERPPPPEPWTRNP